MRAEVISTVHNLMNTDDSIYFLTGDLGYSVLEPIAEAFANRFINAGLAEQHMMGMATGLALSGKKVYVYSIVPFVTMRCFEQIRDDVCYHNAKVTILGIGSGLSYGILGSTHFAVEDIALMRSLPNMTVISPVDGLEASLAIDALHEHQGPAYVRIGKKAEPKILAKPYQFHIGKGHVLREGSDIAVFATGPLMEEVLGAVDLLSSQSVGTICVVNIHTIKPLDETLIKKTIAGKKLIVTIEEHSIIGGLGSAVAEITSAIRDAPPLLRIGTHDEFIKYVGSQTYLRSQLGFDRSSLAATITKALHQKP